VFVSFEGPDGSGKSTQIRLLADRLEQFGISPIVTREPGGTPLGVELRSLLLDSKHRISDITEALLMTADRAEHVQQIIRPALADGKVVITDRFLDSTLAYQGGGRGLPMDDLQAMQVIATGGLVPDMTFLLDLQVEVGLQRKQGSAELNRLDHESLAFHRRVAEAFRRMAAEDRTRWRKVDATQDVQMVHTAVWLHVSAHLEARRNALVRGEVE
jgi:dTMP kinase